MTLEPTDQDLQRIENPPAEDRVGRLIASLLAQPTKPPRAPLREGPCWTLVGVSDVFELQLCESCGSETTAFLYRALKYRGRGPTRPVRWVRVEGSPRLSGVDLTSLSYERDIFHRTIPLCARCSGEHDFAEKVVKDLLPGESE